MADTKNLLGPRNMRKLSIKEDEGRDIYLPNLDSGLFLLPGFEKLPVPVKVDMAKFDYIIASSIPSQSIALHRSMIERRKLDLSNFHIQFASFPVYAENFSYIGRLPRIGGKLLLSGASGRRIRRRMHSSTGESPGDRKIVEQLNEAVGDPHFTIPAAKQNFAALAKLPYLIEAKNLTNFYHFTSETLIYLSLYKEFGLQGEIRLYTSNPQPAASFVHNSIKSFYPELLDRVMIHRGNMEVDKCILPINLQHFFNFKRDLDHDVPSDRAVAGSLIETDYNNVKTIALASRDRAIDLHRSVALALPRTRNYPRYIYVRRKSGNARPIIGEDKLMTILQNLGFVTISFEDYTPAEQAQIINDASIMVSSHGAGFTNMLYGNPTATFIELSNLQLARHRFGEFHMMAAASGATHVHFFTDHDFPDDTKTPNVHADGLRGVRLPEVALNRIDGFLKTLIMPQEFLQFKQLVERLSANLDFSAILEAVTADQRFLYSSADIPSSAALACEYFGDHRREAEFYRIALDVAPLRTGLRPRLIEALVRANDTDSARRELQIFQIMAPRWYDRYVAEAGGADAVLGGTATSWYEPD